jgi:Voltage gated chloride channel
MLLVSLLSAAIGLVAGVVAFALYKLIGLFTNLFFFHRWSADFSSAQHNHLGMVIVTPVIGGLIVGVMAKYGTFKIKGHGIPEAMEAVLFNRSRIAPRVAILKPISAAIAIGTGGPFGRGLMRAETQQIRSRKSGPALCRGNQRAQRFYGDSERAAGEAVNVGGVHSDHFGIGIEYRASAAAVRRGRIVDELVAHNVA